MYQMVHIKRQSVQSIWRIVKLQFDGLSSPPVNCAERLVEMFGTQADVARAFQLDRAVVHNWVKTGYVPARWAGEVERVTEGRISAVDVINEASAKNPVRVKSRPRERAVWNLLRGNHEPVRPAEAHPVLPSAAAHADGARARPRSIRACSPP